ncbi:MAG: DNA translocase FtsK 4TM domain-containing protein [Chloroflexota bacterium]
MDINTDGVSIKRVKAPKKSTPNPNPHIDEPPKNEETPLPGAFTRKAFGALFIAFGALLLIALLSYSRYDSDNLQVGFGEFIRLIGGGDDPEAKAATAVNWLGLLGAGISYAIYHYSFGYISILLPGIVLAWGRSIYKTGEVSDKSILNAIKLIAFMIIFSAFVGAFYDVSWAPDLSDEAAGKVGLFLGGSLAKPIGGILAASFYLGASFAFLVYAFRIKITRLPRQAMKLYRSLNQKSRETIAQTQHTLSDALADASEKIKNFGKEDEEENAPLVEEFDDEEYDVEEDSAYDAIAEGPAPAPEETLRPVAMTQPKLVVEKRAIEPAPPPEPIKIITPDKKKSNTLINPTAPPSADAASATPSVTLRRAAPTEPEVFSSFDAKYAPQEAPPPEPETPRQNAPKITITGAAASAAGTAISAASSATIAAAATAATIAPVPPVVPMKTARDVIQVDKIASIVDRETAPSRGVAQQDVQAAGKPLRVTVNETDGPVVLLKSPISVALLDEKIRYTAPRLDILTPGESSAEINEDELKMNARILQEKLETFKIYIEDLAVTPGPVVTQYEFVPAAGIKISRIESLADDLKMALKAKGIRILAPVPGKGTVGIEIPNSKRSLVRFSEIVRSKQFAETKMTLPLALGKTISGEIYIVDLAEMPHLLIAGATGSGKSVGINTIVASLLYKKKPNELKFVMVDPKKVELSQFAHLRNHFLAKSPDLEDLIITNPKDAVVALRAVVAEMELRYDILASVGQKKIKDYNEKVRKGAFANDSKMLHREMPYIVVVIDELADLMLTAGKDIEEPITRLAQMARAVGIHVIIATQRPSVDVITGLIKANFPARIAYAVATKIDSRTILDQQGADQLLGYGDMLCMPPGLAAPERIQNAFITGDEIEGICEFIGKQAGYSLPYLLPETEEEEAPKGEMSSSDRDPLFEDAARLVISSQMASVSMFQRRLRLGYSRAARVMDELYDAGVVGPADGSKPRAVLMDSESELEAIL